MLPELVQSVARNVETGDWWPNGPGYR